MTTTPDTNVVLLDHAGLKAIGVRYCNTHLIRLEKAGLFPKRLKIGGGRNAWLEAEIRAWIAKQIAARDAAVAEVA